MASVQDHLDSIKQNEEFLAFLQDDGHYPRWAVVVVFYIAVHYGRALTSVAGLQIRHHGHFETEFLRTFKDIKCYEHIRLLKDYSEAARYDNRTFSWQEVKKLYDGRLKDFKSCIRGHGKKINLNLADSS